MIDWKNISLKELAGFVSEELRKQGIDAILVGGACVSLYSRNRYLSYDLDFVTYEDMKKVRSVLKQVGFVEKNRYFLHPNCPWVVEFVSPPIAIGNEPIVKFEEMPTPLGIIKLLRPEDSVKDRLASFFHWDDQEGLDQAISICLEENINLKEIENWSEKEGFKEKYREFSKKFKSLKTRS